MAQPNAMQASSFTCFSKLPREIQLSIWEYSLPPPRMIHISTEILRFSSTNQSARDIRKHIWLERRAVPAILHASVDSRKVGLKHYEPILDTTTKLGFSGLSLRSFDKRIKKPAYVDLARDILVTKYSFYVRAFLKTTPETILNRIRYFAYCNFYGGIDRSLEFMRLMKGLPALVGLAIIKGSTIKGRIVNGSFPAEYWDELIPELFLKLKNDGGTVPKIRMFGDEKDLEKALQNKKLWGTETAVGLLEPVRQSSVENIL